MAKFSDPTKYIFDAQGRLRVEIVQAEGTPLPGGFTAADPPQAKRNMNQLGWCEEDALIPLKTLYGRGEGMTTNPRIELDNGNVIWGYQCWWKPVEKINA